MSLSTDAADLSLSLVYGADHDTALVGATITVKLGTLDVDGLFEELDPVDYPGYADADHTNDGTNFPAPTAGQLDSAELAICTATGDWPDAPTHARTLDGATVLDTVALDNTTGAVPLEDDTIAVTLSIFYDEVSD